MLLNLQARFEQQTIVAVRRRQSPSFAGQKKKEILAEVLESVLCRRVTVSDPQAAFLIQTLSRLFFHPPTQELFR